MLRFKAYNLRQNFLKRLTKTIGLYYSIHMNVNAIKVLAKSVIVEKMKRQDIYLRYWSKCKVKIKHACFLKRWIAKFHKICNTDTDNENDQVSTNTTGIWRVYEEHLLLLALKLVAETLTVLLVSTRLNTYRHRGGAGWLLDPGGYPLPARLGYACCQRHWWSSELHSARSMLWPQGCQTKTPKIALLLIKRYGTWT